ncbi:hypothetical protein L4X63_01505 [Geomonas sp. Red32]|uniref:hypothetical protein n=1 Tax=Geomonas sp. Red32 TaxID=2912856 RepID=UPI00202CEF44|nr:hypothetical protein [Geomonas sp. Red32]MCM0080256.1 hypothetical protein [Geomonas sp. Red32]
MKPSSKLLVLALAGALTATAAPALALENEFHGMFQLQFDDSNFNGTGNLDAAGARYTPDGKPSDAHNANFFEQRARLAYIAKANQDVKLITKFELDYSYWGNSSYTTHRNQGGALGADTVNIETKNIYLDLNNASLATNAKVGMQGVDDAFKGIFFSADMAGLLLTHDCKHLPVTASVGLFRWNDTTGKVNPFTSLGHDARDMALFDGKYKINDNTKVGLAYYFVNATHVDIMDGNGNQLIEDLTAHTTGLNFQTNVGPVTLDGFALYQFGHNGSLNQDFFTTPGVNNASRHRSAWAANVGARTKVGTGTLRSEFLYVSGDNGNGHTTNAFYTPANFGYSESGFWNNEMVILGRDKNGLTNDSAIVFDANNKNQGVYFGSVGYDHPCTDKITASVNAGFAAIAKGNQYTSVNAKTGSVNATSYLGTELNAEANYKFNDSVTFSARGGYVFLGGYYNSVAQNGETPDNPWDVKMLVNYTF